MKQPVLGELFTPTITPIVTGAVRRARRTDPETSHLAAQPEREVDRARAWDALQTAGERGLTDFELGALINRQQTSAGKRRLELQREGKVYESDERRKAPSGASAIVWKARELPKNAEEKW